jgi:prepilin-type N-terminal cleavage/methylation domain-containing protein
MKTRRFQPVSAPPDRASRRRVRLRVPRRSGGFTLLELLIVMGIIGILLGILIPTLQQAREGASLTRELANARETGYAYLLYAEDRGGRVIKARDEPERAVVDEFGNEVGFPANERWYWRLAPYLSFQQSILFRDEQLLEELRRFALEGGEDGSFNFYYRSTLYTAFGINHSFVGGKPEYETNPRFKQLWGDSFYVRRLSDAPRPSNLMVMAAAAFVEEEGLGFVEGFWRIEPPRFSELTGENWQTRRSPLETLEPHKSGYVWQPAAKRVPSLYLDGHAEALSWEEAQDMRRWAPKADSADWSLPLPDDL